MTYNIFILLTGDPGRTTLDPDLLGKGQRLNEVAIYSIKSSTYLHDMYGRFTQMNTSTSAHATLQGEVSWMLLDQLT
jgi:hypothetical protein